MTKIYELKDLMVRLDDYSNETRRKILTAYAFANHAHKGQNRLSGESYISHPTAVACILADMHCDTPTIIAGLLHDVIEDCDGYDYERIKDSFGKEVADLVLGVTNIKKNEVTDPIERRDANLRKIVSSVMTDVRVVIIKFADRLHNMSTMEQMRPDKQVRKASETLEVYAPLAFLLGEYKLKCELEDLSFKYMYPDEYELIKQMRDNYLYEMKDRLDQFMLGTSMSLSSIPYSYPSKPDRLLQIKHLYGIRRRLLEIDEHYDEDTMREIHDLLSYNVFLKDPKACFKAQELIKKNYTTLPDKDRNYIDTPKSNRYMGLHSTAKMEPGKDEMIQFQFKTAPMDKINQYGITQYFELLKNRKGINYKKVQEVIRRMQFYQQIESLEKAQLPPQEYMNELKHDIFTKMIYIHNENNALIEVPNGSTPVDIAYRTNPNQAPNIEKAFVNGIQVPLDYKLSSQDKVKVVYGKTPHQKDELVDKSYAYKTKRLILK